MNKKYVCGLIKMWEEKKTVDKTYVHYTVMKKELVESLNCDNQDKIYVDGTLGGGGHSEEILKHLNGKGFLFSFDIDIDAINCSKKRLEEYKNIKIINDNYTNIIENLEKEGISAIDGGIIFDFGASYHQLTSETRGFSFRYDSKLDMRFNQNSELTAYEIVNKYKEDEYKIVLSKSISKKLDKKTVNLTVHDKKESFVVDYDSKEYIYRT